MYNNCSVKKIFLSFMCSNIDENVLKSTLNYHKYITLLCLINNIMYVEIEMNHILLIPMSAAY